MAHVSNGNPDEVSERLLAIASAGGLATTTIRNATDNYTPDDMNVMLVDPENQDRTVIGFGGAEQVKQVYRVVILYARLKTDANELPDDVRATGRAMSDDFPALIRARPRLETDPGELDGIVAYARIIDVSNATLFGFTGGVYAGLYYEVEVTTYV